MVPTTYYANIEGEFLVRFMTLGPAQVRFRKVYPLSLSNEILNVADIQEVKYFFRSLVGDGKFKGFNDGNNCKFRAMQKGGVKTQSNVL